MLASCAAAQPKRPLAAGYYILDESRIGVERRIVIVAGERRASYDVWRISRQGNGSIKHAHYDLIAGDDVPSSGDFAVTQEGSDCGTLSIEPYQLGKFTVDSVFTVRYGTLGIERFHVLREGDAERYKQYDDAITRRMLQVASDSPQLYGRLSWLQRFFYAELTPRCTYE